MGRGGGRSKASSTGGTFDTEATFVPLNLNISLYEFLLTGHFEEDFFSYCSNRLTDFSCRYWFDPGKSEETKAVTASLFSNDKSSYTVGLTDSYSSAESSHTAMLRLIADTTSIIRGSLTGSIGTRGWASHSNDTTILVNDLIRLEQNFTEAFFLVLLLMLAILVNCLLFNSIRRLAHLDLPIGTFIVYLTVIEICDLTIELVDYIVFGFRGVHMFTLTQFLGRSACQSMSMGYGCLKHVQGCILIALSLCTLYCSRHPERRYSSFRRIWAYNILVLVVALMATLNSQYFWTFDLFQVDNRLPHLSNANSLYLCGFANSWGLNSLYLNYIWPLMDHNLAEFLPSVVPIITASVCFLRLKNMSKFNSGNLVCSAECVSNKKLISEAIWIIPTFCLFCSFSILPRAVYYGMKYFLFSSMHINRVGLIFHQEEEDDARRNVPLMTGIVKATTSLQVPSSLLPQMQAFETSLQFLQPIFAVLKAALLLIGLTRVRQNACQTLSRLLRPYRRIRKRRITHTSFACPPSPKTRTDNESFNVSNNVESISISRYSNVSRTKAGRISNSNGRNYVEEFAL